MLTRNAVTWDRIYSQSGPIDAVVSHDAWKEVPILAVTNHGVVRTNADRDAFADFHLEGKDLGEGSGSGRCTFQGFRTVAAAEDRFAVFELFDRFMAIANGSDRPPGLDLYTRTGRISILQQ